MQRFGWEGIGSLPMLPLELEVVDGVPPLSIPELKDSLFLPHELMACSLSGANVF